MTQKIIDMISSDDIELAQLGINMMLNETEKEVERILYLLKLNLDFEINEEYIIRRKIWRYSINAGMYTIDPTKLLKIAPRQSKKDA